MARIVRIKFCFKIAKHFPKLFSALCYYSVMAEEITSLALCFFGFRLQKGA